MQILEQLANGYSVGSVTEQDIFMECSHIIGYLEGYLQFGDIVAESAVMEGIDIKGMLRKAIDWILGLKKKIKDLFKKFINFIKGNKPKPVSNKSVNDEILESMPYSGKDPLSLDVTFIHASNIYELFLRRCDYYDRAAVDILKMLFSMPDSYMAISGGGPAEHLVDELNSITNEQQLLKDIVSKSAYDFGNYDHVDLSNGLGKAIQQVYNEKQAITKRYDHHVFNERSFEDFVNSYNKYSISYSKNTSRINELISNEMEKLDEAVYELTILSKSVAHVTGADDYDIRTHYNIDIQKCIAKIQTILTICQKCISESTIVITNIIGNTDKAFADIGNYIKEVQSKMK